MLEAQLSEFFSIAWALLLERPKKRLVKANAERPAAFAREYALLRAAAQAIYATAALIRTSEIMPGPEDGGSRVKAYCIVYEIIEDPQTFEEYRRQVMPTIEAHGGRFIVRGGAVTTLEGEMPYERVVVLEFPTRAAAQSWYSSPEYQRIVPLRTQSTRCQFILVDGVESG